MVLWLGWSEEHDLEMSQLVYKQEQKKAEFFINISF